MDMKGKNKWGVSKKKKETIAITSFAFRTSIPFQIVVAFCIVWPLYHDSITTKAYSYIDNVLLIEKRV